MSSNDNIRQSRQFAFGFNVLHPLVPFQQEVDPNLLIQEETKKSVRYSNGVTYEDVCPVLIKWEDEKEWWHFPLEPLVSITGKNNIVKRNVLKTEVAGRYRGTVKELWSQDDFSVSIAGVVIGTDGKYPKLLIEQLRTYCETRKRLEVKGDIFNVFNIHYLAIEDYQFPFTKGIENQSYTIKAVSDDFNKEALLLKVQ